MLHHLSSVAATIPAPCRTIYSATKAAAFMAVESCRVECEGCGVRFFSKNRPTSFLLLLSYYLPTPSPPSGNDSQRLPDQTRHTRRRRPRRDPTTHTSRLGIPLAPTGTGRLDDLAPPIAQSSSGTAYSLLPLQPHPRSQCSAKSCTAPPGDVLLGYADELDAAGMGVCGEVGEEEVRSAGVAYVCVINGSM